MRSSRVVLAAVFLFACSGGAKDKPDAAETSADAAAPADASQMPDGAPATDAAPVIDAGPLPDGRIVVFVDAGPLPDAGPVSEACAAVCPHIFECFMEPPDPSCAAECSAATTTCTLEEVDQLKACASVECDKLEECVTTIPCLSGVVCGDDFCDSPETCTSCEVDCGPCPVCGDGTCAAGECATCVGDCPAGCMCPHDVCSTGDRLEAGCGECEADVCAADSFCCDTAWDGWCVNLAESECGKDCPSICGDFRCDMDETCEGCPDDCCFEDPPIPE